MSGITAAGVAAAAAVVGTAYSVYSGERASSAQEDAMAQQKQEANAALAQQSQAQTDQLKAYQDASTAQQAAYDAQLKAQQEALAQQQKQSDALLQQSQSQASAQQSALSAQLAQSRQSFDQQSQQINRANQRQPDTATIISENKRAAQGGQGGTLLTGGTGVDPSKLTLGKTTLLGG